MGLREKFSIELRRKFWGWSSGDKSRYEDCAFINGRMIFDHGCTEKGRFACQYD